MFEMRETGGYVVWVEFEIHPEQMERFEALLRANAKSSLELEPGCRRFDVMVPNDRKDQIILYEIYDDEAAFTAHLKTPHFLEFNTASAAFVESRNVRPCTLVCEGSNQTAPSKG